MLSKDEAAELRIMVDELQRLSRAHALARLPVAQDAILLDLRKAKAEMSIWISNHTK